MTNDEKPAFLILVLQMDFPQSDSAAREINWPKIEMGSRET